MTKILKLPFGWAEEADELWISESSGAVSLMIKDIWGHLMEDMTSRHFFTPEEIQEILNETAVFEETECPVLLK